MEHAVKAIAEPRRREILRLIWSRELPAGEIASHFAVTRPAISQHLRVLKDAGLVAERRQGTRRLYHAVPERMAKLRAFLEEFWDDQLGDHQAAAGAPEGHEQPRWRRWPRGVSLGCRSAGAAPSPGIPPAPPACRARRWSSTSPTTPAKAGTTPKFPTGVSWRTATWRRRPRTCSPTSSRASSAR